MFDMLLFVGIGLRWLVFGSGLCICYLSAALIELCFVERVGLLLRCLLVGLLLCVVLALCFLFGFMVLV